MTVESVIWGAVEIAKVIDRTEKQTFHLLESGRLPGAQKIAGRWAFKPSVFFGSFENGSSKG